jgi:ADP-dependent NAD(P)H-hydrate dehydratase / NAD(P)H-hydrate epimerase
MPQNPDLILTVAQMCAAEESLIVSGTSVDALMQRAGRGAADYVWRIAAHRRVTVLCGPGNNGGDGYVIAEALRELGGKVAVIAAAEPKTEAARNARALYQGEVLGPGADPPGDILVDCLFGSGLTRALSDGHVALLARLAASHRHAVAIDVPSGVDADSGQLLNQGLPQFDLTIALGAWKFAHFLMPSSAATGYLRLVDIGVAGVAGAAQLIGRPHLSPPAADAHKYRRGLLGIVGGAMPGAALLAAQAAQRAGAGYVKLLCGGGAAAFDKLRLSGVGGEAKTRPARAELVEAPQLTMPPDLVIDCTTLAEALNDHRIAALLIGPGLGRHTESRERLAAALSAQKPVVLDADALMLIEAKPGSPAIATPHEGELKVLEKTFACQSTGSKRERAAALAKASGMVVVAKGPDTVVAAPDGRIACAARASSWLSVAGTGDVLAGTVASRLACGIEPFQAACEGVWLHGEAARRCSAPFTASQLAKAISKAYAACL